MLLLPPNVLLGLIEPGIFSLIMRAHIHNADPKPNSPAENFKW